MSKPSHNNHAHPFQWHVWAAPIVIGIVSAAGLLLALLGDGWWDAASWVLLGIPVLTCVWFGMVRRARSRAASTG